MIAEFEGLSPAERRIAIRVAEGIFIAIAGRHERRDRDQSVVPFPPRLVRDTVEAALLDGVAYVLALREIGARRSAGNL